VLRLPVAAALVGSAAPALWGSARTGIGGEETKSARPAPCYKFFVAGVGDLYRNAGFTFRF
jgi:hypothetical protein